MIRSRGPLLEEDVQADAIALAETFAVPVSAAVSAALDAQSDDSARRSAAEREIAAWRSGLAIDARNLPASEVQTLVVRLGPWVEEEPDPEFPRGGYGYAPGDALDTIAASSRGHWRIAAARAAAGPTRVLAYRRGSLLLHGWAESWTRSTETTFWAPEFYYAKDGMWVNADTRATSPLEPENAAFDTGLTTVPAIIPDAARNSIFWIDPVTGGDHR